MTSHSFVCILCNRPKRSRRALLLAVDPPSKVVLICVPCCARVLDQSEPEDDLTSFMLEQIARDPNRYIRRIKESIP